MPRPTNADLQRRIESLETENEVLRVRSDELRAESAELRVESDELRAESAELRAESSRLRDSAGAANDTLDHCVEGVQVASAKPRRRGWGWTVLATVLIVIGSLLAPVAVVSTWATSELTDTDSFVATFGPLAKNPDVQAVVITQATAAIDNQLDISKLTSNVIDGITSLGTPPQATAALNALKGPAADGVRSLVGSVISGFVKSDAFADIWTQTLRTSHSEVIRTLQNDQNAVVVSGANGSIGIQLGPIIEQLKTVLVERGLTIASQIPTINRTIVVAQSDSLGLAQSLYPLATAVGSWLPWISLLFLAAGVVVARRRALALIWAAIALALTSIILSIGFGVGHIAFLNAVSAAVPNRAASVIYNQVIDGMRETTASITVIAIVAAVVAYLAGPFRVPRSLRGLATSAFAWIRTTCEGFGVTTGKTGEWLYSQRVLIRAAIAVAGSAVVLFVRPLSASLTIWTLVIAVLLIGILELVQRPVIVVPEGADEDTPVVVES